MNEQLNPHDQTEFKQHLLDVLSQFHQFCVQHKLQYFLIGGGLIGAVRHQGFIPWDDDIDVAMPRADYETFLALRDQIPQGYKVAMPFKDKGYTNTKPRMYETGLKIQEQFIKRYTLGPWIDIFPLDHTFDNNGLRKLHFRLVHLFKVLNACKLGGVSVQVGRKRAKAKWLLYYALKPVPSIFLSKPFVWLQTIKKTPGEVVGNLMGRWRENEVIQISALQATTTLDFETIKVNTFKDYELWLRKVYGDYMLMPALEKRIADHYFDIIQD